MVARKKSKAAVHGEKMIRLTVYLWTNNLAGKDDYILPREAWDSGAVSIPKNDLHEIRGVPSSGNTFHGLHDVGRAIERALGRAGIKLHHGRRARQIYVLHDKQAIAEMEYGEGQ